MRRRSFLRAVGIGVGGGVVATSGAAEAGSPPHGQVTAGAQLAKLSANDGDSGDRFGMGVALDGGTAIVGAPTDADPNGANAGAAYVFEAAGGNWTQRTKLAPDDGASGDRFGFPVDLAGSTAVVGARLADTDAGRDGGAVYVFDRDGDDWGQTAKLVPDDANAGDRFGRDLAIEGDTVAGGSITDGGGSVTVFERSGGTWTDQASLSAADDDDNDQLGVSLAIDGGTIVAGANEDDDPYGEGGGSAYVFEREGDSWVEQEKLTAADGESGDGFGLTVAVAGETAFVAAPNNVEADVKSGSVYVFDRSTGVWQQRQQLTAADGAGGDRFGISLAIDGATALIGADQQDSPNGTNAGAVYVFDRSASRWRQSYKLAPDDGDSGDRFGYQLGFDGSRFVAGARNDEDPNGSDAGSAYLFDLPASAPTPTTTGTPTPTVTATTTPTPTATTGARSPTSTTVARTTAPPLTQPGGQPVTMSPTGPDVATPTATPTEGGGAGFGVVTGLLALGVGAWRLLRRQ